MNIAILYLFVDKFLSKRRVRQWGQFVIESWQHNYNNKTCSLFQITKILKRKTNKKIQLNFKTPKISTVKLIHNHLLFLLFLDILLSCSTLEVTVTSGFWVL